MQNPASDATKTPALMMFKRHGRHLETEDFTGYKMKKEGILFEIPVETNSTFKRLDLMLSLSQLLIRLARRPITVS